MDRYSNAYSLISLICSFILHAMTQIVKYAKIIYMSKIEMHSCQNISAQKTCEDASDVKKRRK